MTGLDPELPVSDIRFLDVKPGPKPCGLLDYFEEI